MSDFFRIFKNRRGAEIAVQSTFANVAQSQTDSALVPAVAGKRIAVLALAFVAGDTETTATFNSKPAGAGSAVSMTFANAANGGAVMPHNPHAWFLTKNGEGLSLTTGAGSTTGVQVVYAYVDP
jgi:hypothetical protein